MASSDMAILMDMGFDQDRAEMAVKQSGGLQGALEWLEANQDKSWEDITAPAVAAETDPTIEPEALKQGEIAQSLVCEDCGRRFRSLNQAEAHGERTGHSNFAESTEEVKSLTEEEKKQKLEELRASMREKKAKQAVVDKEEARKNEKIRMKATKEVQDLKENLEKKEMMKAAAAKKQERINDMAAKKRIQERIAADKEERRLKAERQKAEREGRQLAAPEPPVHALPSSASKPAAAHTEARLRLQTANGTVQKTFLAETTLFEVAHVLKEEMGLAVGSFTMTFPKKIFSGIDFGKSLEEAGFVPSAVLIVE